MSHEQLMKTILIIAFFVISGCSNKLNSQEIKFISHVCNKNEGIAFISVYDGGVEHYCNDGARFTYLRSDMTK